jgi:hypothetical protein
MSPKQRTNFCAIKVEDGQNPPANANKSCGLHQLSAASKHAQQSV